MGNRREKSAGYPSVEADIFHNHPFAGKIFPRPEADVGTDQLASTKDRLDYKLVFDCMPGMCLVLDPAFRIVAQNIDHARMTLSAELDVVGKGLFEAFPDNHNDSNADGVSAVRASLVKVLKTRAPDAMPIVRYDVRPQIGGFHVKYWAITNTPILDEDGFVRWIINRAEDVTELVQLRQEKAAMGDRA